MSALLSLQDLKVHFPVRSHGLMDVFNRQKARVVHAVDGVTFEIQAGETLGVVGESGCGKSTTGRAILRLVEPTGGKVFFQGKDICSLGVNQLRQTRRHMQMVFQNPYASLNPRMTVGDIIGEPLKTFGQGGKDLAEQVQTLMQTVGLNPGVVRHYPHEFSGGQRQRIGIARALALNPELVVADEPIAALDVSIQAQILNLLKRLQQERKLTYLFISHDLRAVRHISNRIAVMYLGKIVELGDAKTVYAQPQHPYTQALISAVPVPNPKIEKARQRIVLQGDVPSPINPPTGCRFHTRCPQVMPMCRESEPPLQDLGNGHLAACFLHTSGLKKSG
jgi:oligopeptide transport system ATP-binding protein